MGTYLEPIAGARGNAVVMVDGSIWLNFILTGVNVVPYDPSSLYSAQSQNKALFDACAQMVGTSDVIIGGYKTRVDPRERVQAIVQGLQNLTDQQYPDLLERVAHAQAELQWKRKEHRRPFFVSMRVPGDHSEEAAALAKVGMVDSARAVDWRGLERMSQKFLGQFPTAFNVVEARPEHLVFMHERMLRRGLDAPTMPTPSAGFNPGGFSPVVINKAGDSSALMAEFIDQTTSGATEAVKGGRIAQWRRNYRTARWAKSLTVSSPSERSEGFVDGPTSRQTMLAVAGFPEKPQALINTFTYLVDQTLGEENGGLEVDADFVLRITFGQEQISVAQHRDFEATVDAEAGANVDDRHDLPQYQRRKLEREALAQQVAREPGPRGMAVTAIFALAHPNRQLLAQAVVGMQEKLSNNGFTTFVPVGGQFDLLKQMLPCVRHSALTRELQGVTTTLKFSACMPIRRTEIGDAVGVPLAINKENTLGQVVLYDFLGSTDRGSGSIGITGAQGAGKSYTIKTFIDWLHALRRPLTIFEQSSAREYLTFARSLGNVQVVDARNPQVSLDPLKVFAHDPQLASTVFLEMMQILSGWKSDSPEMLLLSQCLEPSNRHVYKIGSSRELLQRLITGMFSADRGYDGLCRSLSMVAGLSYASALFDPMNQAQQVTKLEPYRRSEAGAVVFLTDGFPAATGDPEKMTPLERFSLVLHTVIAWITSEDYAGIDGLCATIADEVSFWKGSDVQKRLIGEVDKTGRKSQNIIIAGGQLADHFQDPSYELVRKWLTLRQETTQNASAALDLAGFPPTNNLVKRLITDTSPVDPNNNNKPIASRAGEGYYSDGFAGRARVKILPMATDQGRRLADTTSSTMSQIRAESEAIAQQQQRDRQRAQPHNGVPRHATVS